MDDYTKNMINAHSGNNSTVGQGVIGTSNIGNGWCLHGIGGWCDNCRPVFIHPPQYTPLQELVRTQFTTPYKESNVMNIKIEKVENGYVLEHNSKKYICTTAQAVADKVERLLEPESEKNKETYEKK